MADKETSLTQMNHLRRLAEEKTALIIENPHALSPEETLHVLHELRVHQIELEMQNEQLRQSHAGMDAVRARYFDLYNLAPVGYCTVGEKELILEANLTAATLLNVSQSELIARPMSRFILNQDQDICYLLLKNLFETDEPQACELRMIRRDRPSFWARMEATSARNADGAHECRIILSDITERLAGEALRESEEKYRNIYYHSALGIFRSTFEGRFIDMNPALASLLGYDSPQEAIDLITNIAEQVYATPPDRDAAAESVLKSGGYISKITHYRRKDGAPWYGMLHLRIVSDPQGRPSHYEGFVEDITHRKLAEDAMREVEKSLLALLAEKDMLLKEVHHRVKNNLAVVIGLLEMKGQSLANEPARIALAELSGRIKSMAMIHEQLYRSEAFSRIDFQIYLEELCAYLRSSYHLSGDISVCVSAMGVVMGLDIAVPCGLLITELVTNAFKYAFPADRQPEAGCKIDISVQWNGSAYTLAVADNGVGLPAGLDWSNTKTMGLVLVKLLGQHQLQGRIEVDCTGGTTFRLRFADKNKLIGR